ncbi:YdcF family protein [Deminuibacter soli]|uniref:YdcF family protein n=1 Tax=Deminuibacter soli TaxID=2291815 RepID=A0A3E1NDQ7_9BACT|nr:YdcF family protein [Deminuibacter soli]
MLTLLENDAAVKKLLQQDTAFANMARNKTAALAAALKSCNSAFCYTGALKFTDEEIASVSSRLYELYKQSPALAKLVKQQLIPSGCYVLYQQQPDSLLVKAWQQDAKGINYTIGVYAEGNAPNYPKIDSIAFDVHRKAYAALAYDAADAIHQETKDSALFFTIPLNGALRFLEMNERNSAADFEPMASTVNKAAYNAIATTNWSKYKYTLILVPGAGPEEQGVAISAEGMLRCRVAALRYREGLAPFIMVSGGCVHPYKTKFNEAIEMKKYLIEAMGIPEKAILVDPHARHTTTNMRNCVRIIFRYHMPFDKPCITSTDKSQSYYIDAMEGRCRKELQLMPYKLGKRLSDTEREFYPAIESLQINPYEPMDP